MCASFFCVFKDKKLQKKQQEQQKTTCYFKKETIGQGGRCPGLAGGVIFFSKKGFHVEKSSYLCSRKQFGLPMMKKGDNVMISPDLTNRFEPCC